MNSDSDIRTDRVGEHLWVVSAPGERDLADVDELEAVFDSVFEHGSTLVVDLSETTFIDSAVIGLLVSTLGRVEDSQAHDFAVVAPPGTPPRRIPAFRVTLEGEPIILLEHGQPIERNLRKQRITLAELAAQARQNNIPTLDRVATPCWRRPAGSASSPSDQSGGGWGGSPGSSSAGGCSGCGTGTSTGGGVVGTSGGWVGCSGVSFMPRQVPATHRFRNPLGRNGVWRDGRMGMSDGRRIVHWPEARSR